jgi:hypothetical protein
MTAQEQKITDSKTVLKKHNITSAQADVLRRAARKYGFPTRDRETGDVVWPLWDGTVDIYNIRQETLDILKSRSWIHQTWKIDDEEQRRAIASEENRLITSAWEIARAHDPGEKLYGTDLVAALAVLQNLDQARLKHNSLFVKVLKITEAGRAVAAEWKAALGAEEE